MIRTAILTVSALLAFAGAARAQDEPFGQSPQRERVPGWVTSYVRERGSALVVVRLRLDTAWTPVGARGEAQAYRQEIQTAQAGFAGRLGKDRVRSLVHTPHARVRATPAILRELENDPEVLFVRPDFPITASRSPTPAPAEGLKTLAAMNVQPVWDAGLRGAGQRIAVIDFDIDPECLFLQGAVEAVWSHGDGFVEIEPTFGSKTTLSHGTQVAMAAAGRSPFGRFGVAPEARIVACNLPHVGGATPASAVGDALAALWLWGGSADLAAVCLSLNVPSSALAAAGAETIADAELALSYEMQNAAEVLAAPVFVSAGNEESQESVLFPAYLEPAWAVGATYADGTSFMYTTNFSGDVVLLAPGQVSSPLKGSGTSFSAPFVAGGYALLRGGAPGATPQEILDALQGGGATVVVEVEGGQPGEGRSLDVEGARAVLLGG